MSKWRRRQNAPTIEYVAGNGLIDRRALLGRGIAIAGSMGAAGAVTGAAAEPLADAPWSREFGQITPAIQTPSPFEKDVTRALSNPDGEFRNSHARTPHHLLGGTVTPNGLHFAINHCGIPNIDPAQHKLVIHGMVRQPLEFTLETLSRYPLVTRMAFVECAGNSAPMFAKEPMQTTVQMLHGLVSNSEWTGVPLSTLLDEAGVNPTAKWLVAEGADAQFLDRSLPVKKAYDDALIAIYQNGEHLMPGNGYPMRLLLPGYQGNMNVKFVRRIKVIDQPAYSYFETKNYSQVLPGGKTWRFHFLMEVKSFITHPSFGLSLKEPGLYAISGVAYSGTGRIAKVMVSADGGKSWGEAALQGPIHEKAFTRFVMPWRWDGQPAILQSRAYDDGGNVQPLRAEFVGMRGEATNPVKRHRLSSPTSTTTAPQAGPSTAKGRSNMSTHKLLPALALALAMSVAPAFAQNAGLGKPLSETDIAVLPDGTNLPPGSGTPAQGAKIFAEKCSACHGEAGRGSVAPYYPALVGSQPLTNGIDTVKTIANYYAYATTIFDYTRRAMPYNAPRSLTDDQVYSLTAYILALNQLIGENDVMDAKTLPQVKMPNRDNFIMPYPDRL